MPPDVYQIATHTPCPPDAFRRAQLPSPSECREQACRRRHEPSDPCAHEATIGDTPLCLPLCKHHGPEGFNGHGNDPVCAITLTSDA